MRSPRPNRLPAWLPVLLLALPWSLPAAATAAPPPDPASLIEALRQPPPSRSAFFEHRRSPLLATPLAFSGTLERPEPGVLVKRIEQPYREVARIEDGRVDVRRDDGKPRRFSLRRAPELAALMTSIESVLAGDAEQLARHFRLEVEGADAAWTVSLVPKDPRLARRVVSLALRGAGSELRCMDLHLAGGETSRTWLGAQAPAAAEETDAAARDALCDPAG